MREFVVILIAAAIVAGGGWAAWEHVRAQDARIKALTARIEQSDRLAQSADAATTKVIERQTVILKEADHGKAEIAKAVGSASLVPPDVWRATRDAIERMRGQAGSASGDRDAGLAS